MGREQSGFVPYYEQVASILRAYVLSLGEGAPVQLPTERDMTRDYNASRTCIRQALDLLEQDGLIQRTPGRGTLTVPPGIRAWMRLRQSRLITVVCPTHSQLLSPPDYYGSVYLGIAARCQERGIAVAIRHVTGTFPVFRSDYRPEDPARITGSIILGVRDEQVIATHTDAGYPVVSVDYWTRNPKADVVATDCFAEGLMAADLLLSQGHRRFFFLGNLHYHTGGNQHEVDSDLLLAGFQRGLRLAGVPLPTSRIRHCHPVTSEIETAAAWFAGLTRRPTAGLIFSCQRLMNFAGFLGKYGLSCPRDVSLIGKTYLGQDVGDTTALVCDPGAMGMAAVDLIGERAAEKRTKPVVLALRSELRQGQTVHCVPR